MLASLEGFASGWDQLAVAAYFTAILGCATRKVVRLVV